MYSSDSNYEDSDDDEGFAPLKRGTSKITPAMEYPNSKAMSPPTVWSYEALLEFREAVKDSIVLSVDFETVDHPEAGKLHYPKMSELGVAVFDPRDPNVRTTDLPKSATSSNTSVEALAKTVKPEHIITNKWKHITEDTCEASYHRLKNKPHSAQPYRCRFVRSKFMSQADTINRLKDIIRGLSTQNLTAGEMRDAETRSIKLIVWASHCEEQVFLGGGIDLVSLCPAGLDFWDFQLWVPFKVRFPQSSQAKGETAFQSLGALGTGVPLHNGCNDAVAQLISFIRFLVMTQAEWNTWFDERGDLEPISFGWVNPAVYTQNYEQRPIPPPKAKKSRYANKPNKTATTTSKGNSASKTMTYTAKPAPRDVKVATSNNISGQETWSATSSNVCGNNWTNLNNSNKAWFGNTSNGWSNNANSGWPETSSNDWANCSGSGWPNIPTPSSSNSSKTSANSSGWPAGMDGWNDSPAKSTGWPDGMSDVDDSEDTPANCSGWPPGMDGLIDSSDKSTGWPDGMSNMDGAEDPSVNVMSGWPAGVDDPEDTTSAVASGNTKNEKDRENVPSSSDRVLENDEWFTVYHSRRRGKKGPFKPNAYRR